MWRYAKFREPDSYTMAFGDSDSDNRAIAHPKPITNCNAHPSTQADSDSDSTAAAECMCPCVWGATGFTNGHRSWEHRSDARQPDL